MTSGDARATLPPRATPSSREALRAKDGATTAPTESLSLLQRRTVIPPSPPPLPAPRARVLHSRRGVGCDEVRNLLRAPAAAPVGVGRRVPAAAGFARPD